jgi:hypothetical protein
VEVKVMQIHPDDLIVLLNDTLMTSGRADRININVGFVGWLYAHNARRDIFVEPNPNQIKVLGACARPPSLQ